MKRVISGILVMFVFLVCVVEVTGLEVESIKEITNPAEGVDYGMPMFTPDGRVIATTLQKGLVIMNIDGSNRRVIIDKGPKEIEDSDNEYYSISPDGIKVAFVTYPTEDAWESYISVINVDGTGLRELTSFAPKVRDEAPVWSPDGNKIVFHRIKNPGSKASIVICTINVDGSNLIELTASISNTKFEYPVFSPDGTKIACVKDWLEEGYKQRLYLMNIDGTGLKMVSNAAGGVVMKWSRDSKRIWNSGEMIDIVTNLVNRGNENGIISPDWQWVCGDEIKMGEGLSDDEVLEGTLFISGLSGQNKIKLPLIRNVWYKPYDWSSDGKMIIAVKGCGMSMPDETGFPYTLVVIKLR
ncbi:MAG: hypothetical protein AABY84_01290 [Candidatus Firestonebacteria bacterium]|mgnify:CR=1 FL=1